MITLPRPSSPSDSNVAVSVSGVSESITSCQAGLAATSVLHVSLCERDGEHLKRDRGSCSSDMVQVNGCLNYPSFPCTSPPRRPFSVPTVRRRGFMVVHCSSPGSTKETKKIRIENALDSPNIRFEFKDSELYAI